MSDAKTRDTGVLLTYINNSYVRRDGGTPVTGSIDMNGNTLYNVSDPVKPKFFRKNIRLKLIEEYKVKLIEEYKVNLIKEYKVKC